MCATGSRRSFETTLSNNLTVDSLKSFIFDNLHDGLTETLAKQNVSTFLPCLVKKVETFCLARFSVSPS